MITLPDIAHDKAMHAIYGGVVALASAMTAVALDVNKGELWEIALVSSAAAGVAKEVLDWALNKRAALAGRPAPHTVDPLDFMATATGGLLMAAGIWL